MTRDRLWINQDDLIVRFDDLAESIPNDHLRAQLDSYFRKKLSELPRKADKEPAAEDVKRVKIEMLAEFPNLIDIYMSQQEKTGKRAQAVSDRKVSESERFYVDQLRVLARKLEKKGFYSIGADSREGILRRLLILKQTIRDNDNSVLLHYNGKAPTRQEELQRAFRILWLGQAAGSSPVPLPPLKIKLATNRQPEKELSESTIKDGEYTVIFCASSAETLKWETYLKFVKNAVKREAVVIINIEGKKLVTESRTQVFISYSHQDKRSLKELQITLKPSVRAGELDVWDDTKIKSGDKWRDEIAAALKRARIAVLLVSPSFLASDFIADNELPQLLDAAEKDGLRIIWIPVSASVYKKTAIERYQSAIPPNTPLDGMTPSKRNAAWVVVAEKIEQALTA